MVAKAAAVILLFTALSKILGFVREMVLAYVFGAGKATDAYVVALTIPSILFSLLGGALVAGAVPLFASFKNRFGEEEAWRLFSAMITFLLVLLLGFVALGEPLARQLVWLITPKLPDDTALLAASLTRIMLPAVVFLALGNLFNGLLNANQVFGPPALGPVLTNVLIITGIFLGLNYGIEAAAWGTLTGYCAAFAIQIPYLRKVGFRYRMVWEPKHPGMLEAWQLLIPVLIGSGLSQIYLIIDRILASGLAEGSIAALNYAQKVALLPQGVLAAPLATALFPALAERAVAENEGDFARALVRGVSLTFFITLPLAVLLIVLARPTVEVLFMRGAFDERAASMTSLALAMFAVGMVAQCVNPLLTRGFYARQDSVTPLKCAAVAIALNIVLSLILIHPLKHAGLALANSLAATFNIFQLSNHLRKTTKGTVSFREMVPDVVKTAGASLLCALAAWTCDWLLAGVLPLGAWGGMIRLALSGTVGLAVFAFAAWMAKVADFKILEDRLLGYVTVRLPRRLL